MVLMAIPDAQAERWLAIHNQYRCMHGSPDLVWDADVAASAKVRKEGCPGMMESGSAWAPLHFNP